MWIHIWVGEFPTKSQSKNNLTALSIPPRESCEPGLNPKILSLNPLQIRNPLNLPISAVPIFFRNLSYIPTDRIPSPE